MPAQLNVHAEHKENSRPDCWTDFPRLANAFLWTFHARNGVAGAARAGRCVPHVDPR